jgi:phospholipid/cholesterol/gamma-HCH transport system ATP-binding protein
MTDAARETVVKVENLSTRFGDTWIHRHINLKSCRGEVLAVIGSSGAGKTVLLNQIIGLLTPVSGDIYVLGRHIHHLNLEEGRRLRRHWGILFQTGALFSAFNVFDNIAFPLRELHKQGQDIDEEMIDDLVYLNLNMVGLKPETAWKYPSELSGGMIKRAALARALSLEAELLFLDEPTTGLDPVSAAAFDRLLLDLREDLNLSIFMITHDLHNLAALADRVAVIDEGKLLTVGTLEEVAEVNHPFIKEFFHRRVGDEKLRALPAFEH